MDQNKEFDFEDDEIDLLELFFHYVDYWWIIACGALLGAVISGLFTIYMVKPMYKSDAMLYVVNNSGGPLASLADFQIGEKMSDDFSVVALSRPVIDQAIKEVKEISGKEFTREQIRRIISVKSENRIVTITGTSDDPRDVYDIINAISNATADQIEAVMKYDRPEAIEEAEITVRQISPSLSKNLMLGFIGGLAAVVGILTIIFQLNDKIRTKDDVEKYLDVPVLAMIPFVDKSDRKKEAKKNSTYHKNRNRKKSF